MQELTKLEIKNFLIKKNIRPEISWLYIQFDQFFEEEYFIDNISLQNVIKNLVTFLEKKKISNVIFFPEPSFDNNITSGVIESEELRGFLKNNVETITNTHVADRDLNWIFTITHEGDFSISGSKNLVVEFISFFKDAKCISCEKLKRR